mgnify:CR=1 FL=1
MHTEPHDDTPADAPTDAADARLELRGEEERVPAFDADERYRGGPDLPFTREAVPDEVVVTTVWWATTMAAPAYPEKKIMSAEDAQHHVLGLPGMLKTFALRGIKDSPPYLHDDRLLTLNSFVLGTWEWRDVVTGKTIKLDPLDGVSAILNVDATTGRNLIDSMSTEVVVTDHRIRDVVPGEPISYREAVLLLGVPEATITTRACPLFVPLVEEGWLDHEVTRLTAREYLKPAREAAKLICKSRFLAFGCEGQAGKIKPATLEKMAEKYKKGELAQIVQ